MINNIKNRTALRTTFRRNWKKTETFWRSRSSRSLSIFRSKDHEDQNEFKNSKHQSKIDYTAIQCAYVERFNNDFMFNKFRHKEIRYFNDSKALKKHTHENHSSFFKRHILTNILRFKENKQRRNKNMFFRE